MVNIRISNHCKL